MNPFEYKNFYDRVGKTNGWNFSNVKCVSDGTQQDIYTEVKNICKSSDLLLDIGTGCGEAILSIAESALLLIGIDQSTGMLETATRNGAESGIANVRFLQMAAEHLQFPPDFFDIVSCRHSAFSATEVARVLKKGATFLTQQVSEDDKSNIKDAFGRGQAFGTSAGTLQQQYVTDLHEAGFSNIRALAFNATEYYETVEDLIFLLKHTPIIPDFGQNAGDFQILQQFVRDNQTEKGIRTNAGRFVITATL